MRTVLMIPALAACTVPTLPTQIYDQVLVDTDEDGAVEVLTLEARGFGQPRLTLFDPGTGARWTSPQVGRASSVGLQAAVADGVVIASATDGAAPWLAGVSANTGDVLWERPAPSEYLKLVEHAGAVLISATDSRQGLLTERLDPATGQIRWVVQGQPFPVDDGLVVQRRHSVFAVDPATSKTTPIRAPAKISGLHPAGPTYVQGGAQLAGTWGDGSVEAHPHGVVSGAPYLVTRTDTHLVLKDSLGPGPKTVFGVPLDGGDGWSVDFPGPVEFSRSLDEEFAGQPIGPVLGLVLHDKPREADLLTVDSRNGAITGRETVPATGEWRRCGAALIGLADGDLFRADAETGAWTHRRSLPDLSGPFGKRCSTDRLVIKHGETVELIDLTDLTTEWSIGVQRP